MRRGEQIPSTAREFVGILFDLAQEWRDITDSLPDGGVPTLAREAGVGAVQFTVAKYACGKPPNIDQLDLRELMLEKLGTHRFRGEPVILTGSRMVVCECVTEEDTLVAMWYLTDGMSLAFVTYCAGNKQAAVEQELTEVRAAVRSMRFT